MSYISKWNSLPDHEIFLYKLLEYMGCDFNFLKLRIAFLWQFNASTGNAVYLSDWFKTLLPSVHGLGATFGKKFDFSIRMDHGKTSYGHRVYKSVDDRCQSLVIYLKNQRIIGFKQERVKIFMVNRRFNLVTFLFLVCVNDWQGSTIRFVRKSLNLVRPIILSIEEILSSNICP